MANPAMSMLLLPVLLLFLLLVPVGCTGSGTRTASTHNNPHNSSSSDAHSLQVALNLEFLEAEFFLNSVYGYGLERVAPELAATGNGSSSSHRPRGAQKARLDALTADLGAQFALQEVGHLRAIHRLLAAHQQHQKSQPHHHDHEGVDVDGDGNNGVDRHRDYGNRDGDDDSNYYFSRPQLDVSRRVFADLLDAAVGERLHPRFDVYAGPVNFMLGVYVLPYVGLTGYVGAAGTLTTPAFQRLVAGLLAVEAGQDAVTRQYLYERRQARLEPYRFTVEDVTDRISALRNRLAAGDTGSGDGDGDHNRGHNRDAAGAGRLVLDEGLKVPKALGAEQRVTGNLLAGDADSVAYATTPEQIFRTVYATGDASKAGGFFPDGAKGHFAATFLAA